jgi:plasmid stability protein
MLAHDACIAYNQCMQYTIRNIPSNLDAALRRRAQEQGKSLNEVAIEALARGAGISGERIRKRDLSFMVGTWQNDPAIDQALADQDQVDEEMWR